MDKIQLPTFSGDLIEWEAFSELFCSLVINNDSFDGPVKLHLLRTHVKGPAYDIVKRYKLVGTNFKAAWEALLERYNNKNNLIGEHLKTFFESPMIDKLNGDKLRSLVDTTRLLTTGLPNLGIDVDDWDPILEFVVEAKLDNETRRDWKLKKGNREQVRLNELLAFIEQKAIQATPSQEDYLRKAFSYQKSTSNRDRQHGKKSIMLTTETPNKPLNLPKCLLCMREKRANISHHIFRCGYLKSMTTNDRITNIRDLKICFKCLTKHERDECKFGDCLYCGGPHNLLLCLKREKDRKSEKENPKSEKKTKNEAKASKN